jgi:hypothetical protein
VRQETVLGVKLAEKGFVPRNIKFQIAIARYQNSGGEYGVALAMLNAAFGRGSEGQKPEAADKAGNREPDAAARKMPGHARRGAAAIGAVQGTMQKSLFDSTILPDGRTLREVKWSECPRLSRRYRYLSRVLMAIHNVGIPADPNDTIDNLVNEDGLKEIISAVERFNDIH